MSLIRLSVDMRRRGAIFIDFQRFTFVIDPRVPQVSQHFEDFTTCREHAPAGTFVSVQSMHELDFLSAVVSFAGRRVNMTAALHRTTFAFAPFTGDGHFLLTPFLT